MHDHSHHSHDHDHEGSELSPIALRVRALESILVEKGYVDPAALDVLIETYETKIGPRNGARVVARAWADEDYRSWLRADATAGAAQRRSGPQSLPDRYSPQPSCRAARRNSCSASASKRKERSRSATP